MSGFKEFNSSFINSSELTDQDYWTFTQFTDYYFIFAATMYFNKERNHQLRKIFPGMVFHNHFFKESLVGKKLYVGNLSFSIGDAELQQLFAEHGSVESAQVILDRDTGRSKGFGFVEMGSDEEAASAISALNSKELDGRALNVNEARPKTQGGRGGGRGGGGYGGGRRDRY